MQNALKEAIAGSEGIEADSRIVTGLVNAEHIAETAEETQADLIVMGSHGQRLPENDSGQLCTGCSWRQSNSGVNR